jgi:hypothetical protein
MLSIWHLWKLSLFASGFDQQQVCVQFALRKSQLAGLVMVVPALVLVTPT